MCSGIQNVGMLRTLIGSNYSLGMWSAIIKVSIALKMICLTIYYIGRISKQIRSISKQNECGAQTFPRSILIKRACVQIHQCASEGKYAKIRIGPRSHHNPNRLSDYVDRAQGGAVCGRQGAPPALTQFVQNDDTVNTRRFYAPSRFIATS